MMNLNIAAFSDNKLKLMSCPGCKQKNPGPSIFTVYVHPQLSMYTLLYYYFFLINSSVLFFFRMQHLKYHSEIMSLHGFHFEMKAVRDEIDSKYSFFLQVGVPVFVIFVFLTCRSLQSEYL